MFGCDTEAAEVSFFYVEYSNDMNFKGFRNLIAIIKELTIIIITKHSYLN